MGTTAHDDLAKRKRVVDDGRGGEDSRFWSCCVAKSVLQPFELEPSARQNDVIYVAPSRAQQLRAPLEESDDVGSRLLSC